MKYSANFVKTKQGNGIKSGSVLVVSIPESKIISGGVYKDGFPVVIDQDSDGDLKFILKHGKNDLQKGVYELRIRAYDEKFHGFKWNDRFVIF